MGHNIGNVGAQIMQWGEVPTISSSDLDFLIEILTPFDALTKEFSKESFPTLGLKSLEVKKFLSKLLHEIEEVLATSEMKHNGENDLEENDDAHTISATLMVVASMTLKGKKKMRMKFLRIQSRAMMK
eukprot:TRINITY_DN3303_c0_g1_i1.p1 TRINITY_DN3303_c0_g1~~TRINITY_DN3303_c0_g1_i1.p1  ORF type:complete len:128 (-),score=44.45 TRINITY_DN3303_c0_g1_i1:257-640(-)